MPYCPKCGNQVDENMTFCPRCGASLKIEAQAPTAPPAPSPPPVRSEKQEKGEKQEKHQEREKGEKHEKGEFGFVGFLIAGLVVVTIGVLALLRFAGYFTSPVESALTLLVVGLAIIIVGIYVVVMARRRYPPAS